MEEQMLLCGVDGSEVFTEEMLEAADVESACLQHNLEVARNYGKELGRLLGTGKIDVKRVISMIDAFAVGLTAEYDLDQAEIDDIREACAAKAAAWGN